ncbi:hypothetical protein EYR36_009214 [Pleurotus pulmonarius]|nr:hypothetical protein EYR36_009214 [Pleurotus pulmonarius]KAF4592714.1 hypothetical protein EYR38_008414 [Pleurotus pulmonarius]
MYASLSLRTDYQLGDIEEMPGLSAITLEALSNLSMGHVNHLAIDAALVQCPNLKSLTTHIFGDTELPWTLPPYVPSELEELHLLVRYFPPIPYFAESVRLSALQIDMNVSNRSMALLLFSEWIKDCIDALPFPELLGRLTLNIHKRVGWHNFIYPQASDFEILSTSLARLRNSGTLKSIKIDVLITVDQDVPDVDIPCDITTMGEVRNIRDGFVPILGPGVNIELAIDTWGHPRFSMVRLPHLAVHFVLVALSLCSLAKCTAPRPGFQEILPRVDTSPGESHFIDIPLDHFSNSTQTFKNRFWVNDTYFEPGGPVFLFDSGEQDAAPLHPYYLQEYHGLSAVMRLAKRYKGLAILWEHRFYGDSLPFPVNRNTTADQWKFLNTEQALEDVIFFANSFGSSYRNDSSAGPLALSVHPSTTPWVFLGGSYPGVRAAFLRIRNPETIFASWASSAPVHAQVDMASYYMAAERSLTRNCSADWVAVTKYVDGALKGNDQKLKDTIKQGLLNARQSGPGGRNAFTSLEESAEISDLSAASILIDPLDFYQYYGFAATLLPFCNLLETRNFTSDPLEGGLTSRFGVETAFRAFLVAIAELDYDSIPRGVDDPVTDRSWMWQYCSEYGFYQRGDATNPLSIQTSLQSLELFQEQCNSAFPQGLPASPQVGNVNKYGGWTMNPSNVLFTNGEFDPWRTQGLASIEVNSPHRTPSVSIPKCNVAPPNSSFFGLTYANMVHVSDMRVLLTPDSNHTDFQTVGFYSPISQEQFFTGLGLFQLALDEWLPCFTPRQT